MGTPPESDQLGLFESALDAIVVMDSSGVVTAWNRSAEQMFGHTKAKALGRTVAELVIPPRLHKAHNDGLEHYLRTGEGPVLNRHIELAALHRDGHEFPVELTIIAFQHFGSQVFCAFLRDITDRVAAREATKSRLEAEERFRLLVDSVTDYAIYMLDPQGRITTWNSGAQRIKGYTADEIIGRHVSVFYTEEGREAGGPQAALAIAEREGHFESENWRVRMDGSKFWANVVIEPIRDDAGKLIGFAKVTRDITDRKRSEEAEQASRAKTDFLASMSHEIRTPLNGIIGYTDLLLDQDLKPEQRRLLERVQFAGAALLTVVNDILDFSTIEAGQITLSPHPFSLKTLVDNTVSIIAELAERKDLAMQVDLDPHLPVAFVGDEARLRQILLNLLNNALKFTQKGGIRLQVGCDHSSDDCERICFSVKDTGIGIPQDRRRHIFHRFYQGDVYSTRKLGGTGLGLAISKQLVELMGGEIGVESEEGKGSTFWFRVPLPRADEAVVAEQLAVMAGEASLPGRILLVEDLEHNRDLARMILMNAGHEVDTAVNGAEAVLKLQNEIHELNGQANAKVEEIIKLDARELVLQCNVSFERDEPPTSCQPSHLQPSSFFGSE